MRAAFACHARQSAVYPPVYSGQYVDDHAEGNQHVPSRHLPRLPQGHLPGLRHACRASTGGSASIAAVQLRSRPEGPVRRTARVAASALGSSSRPCPRGRLPRPALPQAVAFVAAATGTQRRDRRRGQLHPTRAADGRTPTLPPAEGIMTPRERRGAADQTRPDPQMSRLKPLISRDVCPWWKAAGFPDAPTMARLLSNAL